MSKKTIINRIGNSKILWIVISVALALLLWVYVTMNEGDDYSDTFDNVQVVFSGEEALREAQGLIVTEKTRDKVSVTLKGSRREISKLKDSDIQAVIDLSTITRPGTNSNYYYTVAFKPDVETNSITVESRNPRTVSFTVDRYSYKYVEVKGVFNGRVAEGFKADVSDMIFEPSSIRVSGPEEAIAPIKSALVVIERDEIDGTIKVDMGYTLVDLNDEPVSLDDVSVDSESVNVTFPVTSVKSVPLVLDIMHGAGTTDANVMIEYDPESILLSGDAELLKGINRITLGSLDLTSFNSTFEKVYTITLPNDVVNESGISEVKVNVRLLGLQTRRLSVSNIVATNVPDGYEVEVTTKSIDVTIRAPESVIYNIESSNLRAVLDLSEYSGNEGQFTVPASIRVDGFSNAGVIDPYNYSALVMIRRAPEDEAD
ncbi:MAG: hypothetical protein IKR07_02970 [Oscillospiraceae bacterium]|nr:hypothetical protein [Oscillospiraceae bacterium]